MFGPPGLLNPELHAFYNPDGEIDGEVLVDLNSGNVARGICALPYTRLSDDAETLFPVNTIGNLLRPALRRRSDLSETEAAALLADLQTMNRNDERPLWEILGLAIPIGTP